MARSSRPHLRLLALLAAAAACGEPVSPAPGNPTGPSDVPLAVTLRVEPHVVVPGQRTTITATATVPDTMVVTRFALRLRGFGGDTTLYLPIETVGPVGYDIALDVPVGPIAGVLHFTAVAYLKQQADSAADSLVIQDDGPPRATITAPQIIEPPDSFRMSYDAQDSAGIASLAVHVGGAIQWDTVIHAPARSHVAGTFSAWVPLAVPLGDSVTVSAQVQDGFAKNASAARLARVADTSMPTFTTATVDSVCHPGVDCGFFSYTFFPGDTVRIRVAARDNRTLARIGYRMLQFGDSVAPGTAADSASFQLVLPAGTNVADAHVTISAVDSSGNRAVAYVWAHVMDGTFRPIQAITYEDPPGGGSQNPWVLDRKRDVLYFETFGGSPSKVQAVALNPLSALPAIDFGIGHFVRGLDLTPDGDSLVVVIEGRPNLLVKWDIAAGPSTADTIPLTSLGACDAWNLQVAANDHAFVSGWSASGCPVVVDVDLRTGSQQATSLPGALRALSGSPGRTVVVAADGPDAAVYHTASGTWGPVRTLFPADIDDQYPAPAFDETGTAILMRNRLYDSDLTSYHWILSDPGTAPPGASLSADGQTAFVGNWPGYWRVDAATGTVSERIILPRFPGVIIGHPDGQRLIVSGWRWVGIVDLR